MNFEAFNSYFEGVEAVTRYTVHGRGAKLLMHCWNQFKSMRMELSSILRIGLRKNTQDRRDCDFAPFPPGKTPWSLFAFFFKKVKKKSSKKGVPEPADPSR